MQAEDERPKPSELRVWIAATLDLVMLIIPEAFLLRFDEVFE